MLTASAMQNKDINGASQRMKILPELTNSEKYRPMGMSEKSELLTASVSRTVVRHTKWNSATPPQATIA